MNVDGDWELRAVCRDLDPEVFFQKKTRRDAKAACARCPVTSECLATVLVREEGLSVGYRDGIFAGLNPRERFQLSGQPARSRGPGRKPSPCGTDSAYERHQRKGEPADQACLDAHARAHREYRLTGSKVLTSR
ncbi:WhiB family transcriptional regulator [Streptomyces sp. NPDC056785]|uniref:WhiB family transcriptional regulator n=1 Tax=Streptomyces sp. NPDC056785 TaxID=3345944 RepID=UPI00369D837F